LVALAELAAEGFGPWDSPYTKGPRDVIEALAAQLDGEVVDDDLGRRCVSRETALRLFAERAEYERRTREAAERHQAELAELAAKNRPPGGVPAKPGQEDASPIVRLGAEHDFAAADERMDAFISGVSIGRRFQIPAEEQ
jgi:hypothetical protein